MRETLTGDTDVRDSDLVVDALWGDGDAIAAIHHRYVDEIHDLCWLRLRDDEAAGEVTRATFVAAMEQLWQLREADGLRDWLREIADRRIDARLEDRPPSDETDAPADVERHLALRPLLWDDAHGLTDRDRRVLARHLGDGLDGTELARAVGVPPDACAGLLTRLRDRVNRTLGALVVARLARAECDELDAVLREWNTSVLARGRVTSHVDACERCAASRDAVNPWSLLSAVPVVFASPELRDSVVHDMREVAAKAPEVPPNDDPPAADATTSELRAPTGRHQVLKRHARPLILSGTTRVIAALLLAAGMTGGAVLEFSDAAWVTVVKNEASELGGMLAGDDRSSRDRAPTGSGAPPVTTGTGSVAGGPGTAPGGAASGTTADERDRGPVATPLEAPPAAPQRTGDQAPPSTIDGAEQPGEAAAAPGTVTTGPPAKLAITGVAAGRRLAADVGAPLAPTDVPRAVVAAIPDVLVPDTVVAPPAGEAETSTALAGARPASEDPVPSRPASSAGEELAAVGDAAGTITRQVERTVIVDAAADATPAEEARNVRPDAEPTPEAAGSEDAPDPLPLRTLLTTLLPSTEPQPEAEATPVPDETSPEPQADPVPEPETAEGTSTSVDEPSRERSPARDDASGPDDGGEVSGRSGDDGYGDRPDGRHDGWWRRGDDHDGSQRDDRLRSFFSHLMTLRR